MDAYKTAGAFSWSELMTRDPQAAADFYGRLFGWKVEPMSIGDRSYRLLKVGDTSVGGIMGMPPDMPSPPPPAWGCYVTVDDVEATARLCRELGGSVLAPPFDVPGVGRMTVLQDPQGAMINAISYAME